MPGGWLAEWSENDKRVTYLHVPSRALCPHHPVPSPVDLLSHRVCMPTTLHTPRKIDTIPFGSGKGGAFRHRASLRLRGRRQVPASQQQQQQQQRDRHLEYVERCVAAPLLSRGDRWRSRRDTARRYRYIRRTVFCRAMQTHQPLLTNLPPQEAQTNGCAWPPNRRHGGLPRGGMQGSSRKAPLSSIALISSSIAARLI